MREPYDIEELAHLISGVEVELEKIQSRHPDARPLPPLTENEAKNLLLSFLAIASGRRLTFSEIFMAQQTIAAYCMSVEARMLGKPPGRYYVTSEEDLKKVLGKVK